MPQRLLIVEKDGAICELARKALIPAEWRVATEEEAGRALFGISAVTPDIVVCAADLGEMSGSEFAEAVLSIPAAKHVPVIVVGGAPSETPGVFALEAEAGPRDFENALYDALSDVSIADGEVAESVELDDIFESDTEGAGENERSDGGGLEVLELGDVEGGMELLEAIELPEADPDFVSDEEEAENIELVEALELPETADEDEAGENTAPSEEASEEFCEELAEGQPPSPVSLSEEDLTEKVSEFEAEVELLINEAIEPEISPEPEIEQELEVAPEPARATGEEDASEVATTNALSIEEAESLQDSTETATTEVEGISLDESLWELEEEAVGSTPAQEPEETPAKAPVPEELSRGEAAPLETSTEEPPTAEAPAGGLPAEELPAEEAGEEGVSDVVCELALNDDAKEAVKNAVAKAVERALTQEAIASLINSAVEKIVWEVVPPLAEKLILEAIEKLKEPPGES